MKLVMFLLVLMSVAALQAKAYYPTDTSRELTRIAFGSCNDQRDPATHWPVIEGLNPELFIWMGDNIYADARNLETLRDEYARQLSHVEYEGFRSRVPIIGTWDDHDYGTNDSGIDYALKRESQMYFLDFMEEPLYSPRWLQEGIYTSMTFGPPGRQVQIFLLDMRYFRTKTGFTGDPLGEPQWEWLERELRTSRAELKLIVSSTQLKLELPVGERWGLFPEARERFFSIIRRHKIPGVVVLSGDKHVGVIDKIAPEDGVDYPLYDITASGLTHGIPKIGQPLFRAVFGKHAVLERNFGTLEIDWNQVPARVRFQIRHIDGSLAHQVQVSLGDLVPKARKGD